MLSPANDRPVPPAEPNDPEPEAEPVLDPDQAELAARLQSARECQQQLAERLQQIREFQQGRRVQRLHDPTLQRDQLMSRLLRLRELEELMSLNAERRRLEEETLKLAEKNLIEL